MAHLPFQVLVHPQVLQESDTLHRAEIAFPVVALEPRLGETHQRSYWPPDHPELLDDAQVGLPHPLLLLLSRGSRQRLLVVLVKPGQKIQAILYNNRIELILVQPLRTMRWFLRGIDTRVEREKDRL